MYILILCLPELITMCDCCRYQNDLPKKIKGRGKEGHLTHEELVQTIKWKLAVSILFSFTSDKKFSPNKKKFSPQTESFHLRQKVFTSDVSTRCFSLWLPLFNTEMKKRPISQAVDFIDETFFGIPALVD